MSRLAPPGPSRAPRVAYVTSSRGVAGGEQLIVALAAGGRARGWEQTVLNPFGNAGSAALAERCAPVPCETRECESVRALPGLRAWMGSRLADLQPDIVHVVLFQATVFTAAVPRHGERRIVTHMYGEGLAQLSHSRIRERLDRWACRRYDRVFAISDAVLAFLERSHGVPPPPAGRIRLGWDGDPLPHNERADRPPTVVCVAQLRPEKGHDTLLAAFAEVRKEIPEARLVLVGDGPQRPHVERTISTAGMVDNVHLTGRVTDIWPHLADADVFALSSPSEALGVAIQEAMAAGLPVVASDVGGIPELVTPGVTGELFPVGDHREMARKLVALLRSPQRRRAMSAAALAEASAMRMELCVDAYFRVYDELLTEPGNGMVRDPVRGSSARITPKALRRMRP